MSNDAVNIPPLPPVTQAPSSPAPQTSGQQPVDTGASAPSSPGATQGQTNQGLNDNQNPNSTPSAGNGHFSQLLSSNPQATTGAKTNGTGTGGKQGQDTQGNGSAPSGHSSTNDNNNTNIIAAVILTQVQQLAAQTTAPQTDDSASALVAPAGASAPVSPEQSLLQQIEQLLSQLNANTTPSAGTASSAGGSSTPNVTSGNQQPAQSSSPEDANTLLAQILSQLTALLAASTAAAGTAVAANASSSNTVQDATSGTNAGSSDQTALLANIVQLLEAKLNSGATPSTPASTGFDAALNALATPTTTQPSTDQLTSTLQSALSQITNLFAATASGNSSNPDFSGNGNKDSQNNNPSAGTTPTPVANVLGTTTPTQTSATEFAKLVPQAPTYPSPADQVLVQIKNALSDGTSQIKIQLEPADLGKVMVQLNTGTDGKTGITITADNRQTLSMLQNEARSLEAALRNIGLKTDTGGLSFNLRGQGQQNQQNQGGGSGYTQVAALGTADDEIDNYTPGATLYRLSVEQGLDIRV